MAVFWDFASLHQKDPMRWDPCVLEKDEKLTESQRKLKAGYEESRGADESAAFHTALKTMHIWYAHRCTTVYFLTRLPMGWEHIKTYHLRGWPTFEHRLSALVKCFRLKVAGWTLCMDLGSESQEATQAMPTAGNDFSLEVTTKQFTNNSDSTVVATLYSECASEVLKSMEDQDYEGCTISPAGAKALGGALQLCINLRSIDLRSTQLNDLCMANMCERLEAGMLSRLINLSLNNNFITRHGLEAFSEALTLGAMPNLRKLDLERNPLGTAQPLIHAFGNGAAMRLCHLDVSHTGLQDDDAIGFTELLDRGRLHALRALRVTGNDFSSNAHAELRSSLVCSGATD
uniref:Uncharacterized protein n=1 Tax=Haptolina ericina TaxID=156174 RepID=A0A7S3F5I2_9EUKA